LARYFRDHDGPLTALRNVITTLLLRKHHEVFEGWRRGLDLVALGTLADLMPLRDENRILVRMGLERLNGNDPGRFRREALRELLIRQDLHQTRVGTTEVSWQICPLINSAGRMGKADVAARLLLEEDAGRCRQLADEIVALNKERRNLGADLWDRLQGNARESVDRLGGKMLMVADPSIPRGITGILASRWSKAFGVTSVVIAIQGAGASGSVRCTGGFDVLEWMRSMDSLFEDFGGHPCAGGFRLPAAQVETLEKRSAAWLAKQPRTKAPDDILTVDAELNHESLDALGLRGLEEVLQKLEPYGEGFKPLMFLTRKVKILDADLVGKPKNNHLKLLVSLGSHKWPAFWWDAADKYGEHLRVGSTVDLVYRVDRDKWRGGDARRLTVMEAIPCRDS
jgi:single-stranded-DNA-specific exonuclease